MCKTELAELVHVSMETAATIGNDGDEYVDIDVFSASDRDRLTEYERLQRKSELAAYDRNKRIEEAVKYRVASEIADYDRNGFTEDIADNYHVVPRVESPHVHIIEEQDEPDDPFPSVADKVRAEARRLQLRAQEIALRREQLLAEQDCMKIIDVQCQGNFAEPTEPQRNPNRLTLAKISPLLN